MLQDRGIKRGELGLGGFSKQGQRDFSGSLISSGIGKEGAIDAAKAFATGARQTGMDIGEFANKFSSGAEDLFQLWKGDSAQKLTLQRQIEGSAGMLEDQRWTYINKLLQDNLQNFVDVSKATVKLRKTEQSSRDADEQTQTKLVRGVTEGKGANLIERMSQIEQAQNERLITAANTSQEIFKAQLLVLKTGNKIEEQVGKGFGKLAGAIAGMLDIENWSPKSPNSTYAGKAAGGPVSGGRPYVVGEKGPEMFTPKSSGTITPNNKIGGSTNINITINIDGSQAPMAVGAEVRKTLSDIFQKEIPYTEGLTVAP